LQQQRAVRREVTAAGAQEGGALRVVGRIDQLAGEQHGGEAPAEVERFDVGEHRLGAVHIRQHRRRLIDRDDRMPKRQQGMRDAPGAAAEFQQRTAGRHRGVDQLRLAVGRQHGVEANRAAVRRDALRSFVHRFSIAQTRRMAAASNRHAGAKTG